MSGKAKGWRDIAPAGVCSKSSIEFFTGDWKTYMPVRDAEKCTRCLLCVIFCPDGAVHWIGDKADIEFDLRFCKGCGICAHECPTKAISMKLERE
ncbi:MAG: 4Fe-4S binding protein [Candidatus Bathyarchaeia archaeon]